MVVMKRRQNIDAIKTYVIKAEKDYKSLDMLEIDCVRQKNKISVAGRQYYRLQNSVSVRIWFGGFRLGKRLVEKNG